MPGRPGRDHATRRPFGRDMHVLVERPRKEGEELALIRVREFGFLKQGKVRGGIEELGQNKLALLSVTQTSHVPGAKLGSGTHARGKRHQ